MDEVGFPPNINLIHITIAFNQEFSSWEFYNKYSYSWGGKKENIVECSFVDKNKKYLKL